MNNAQLKYVRERLQKAKDDKFNNLPSRYGYPDVKKDELYKKGEYDVEKVGSSYKIIWDGEAEWVAKRTKERQELSAQYQKVMDEIMLGDDDVAIQLINNFIGE